MSKEKSIEATEIFTILSETINGANFDDLCDAAHRIVHIAGYHKQREGEWEELGQDYANCSACGTIYSASPTMFAFKQNNKFCRHCGAKMKGGN